MLAFPFLLLFKRCGGKGLKLRVSCHLELLFCLQVSLWQPAASLGVPTAAVASAGDPTSISHSGQESDGREGWWSLISRRSQLVSGEGVSAGG